MVYLIYFLILFIFLIIYYIYFFNILHYNNQDNQVAYYLGKDIKVDKNFNWLEYKNNKYYKYNNYIYYNNSDIYFTYKHLFFKIDDIVYKETKPNKHNIPKIIWQTLHKEPEENSYLYKLTKRFKNQKEWKYNFVNDSDAEKFIKENFEPQVLNAFKVLIPGAFKADLLRACLLYIHGGVYADIKLKLLVPLDFILDNDLVLVKEINKAYQINNSAQGIWNGFIATIPKQKYFKNVIDNIVKNVANKYYAKNESKLSVTGPVLYGKNFQKTFNSKEIKTQKNITILEANDTNYYLDEKNYISKGKNYQMLISWSKNRNYLKNFKNDYSKLSNQKKIYDLELHKKLFN